MNRKKLREVRILRNKKGDILLTLFAFAFMIGIITFYIASSFFGPRFFTDYIGEISHSLIKQSHNAEKDLIYVDQAAKYSAYQAAYELALNGGYLKDSECGNYGGYAIWNSQDKNCFPDRIIIETNYKFYYDYVLGRYMQSIPHINFEAYINYDYEFNNTDDYLEIIAKTEDKFHYPIEIKGEMASIETDISSPCEIPELAPLSDLPIACSSRVSCEISPSIMTKLKEAADEANKLGYELVVTSAYRPYHIQREWYNNGPPGHSDWAKDASKVSPPSCQSPHMTGQAVDVTLRKGEAYLTFGKEQGLSTEDMGHPERRILEEIMCKVGFVRYTKEYWHYEYGTDRWGRGTKRRSCSII